MAELSRRFTVALIGFSEIERKVLSGVFRLSDQRPVGYLPIDADTNSRPDIVLIDGDDAAAVARWRATPAKNHGIPVIAGQSAVAGLTPILSRPLQWARLLKALDAIVADERLIPGSMNGAVAMLVADATPSLRIFLKQKFEPLGCSLSYADSGEAALAMLPGRRFGLVFLDVALTPDAYQICKQIKAEHSDGATPRVVMLTRGDMPFNKLRGAMSGCDGNLTKPIDEARLNALIDRYFPLLLRMEAATPVPPET